MRLKEVVCMAGKDHPGMRSNQNPYSMKNMNDTNRRTFLRNTAMGATVLGLAPTAFQAMGSMYGSTILNRVGLYSITFLGVWYDGPALSLEDTILKARELGFEGIEIDGKRPHGNPLDMPKARCKEIRNRAHDQGLEIYAVSAKVLPLLS